MNTRPNTSQADRDVLNDVGLPDAEDRADADDDSKLFSHIEPEPT